MITPDSELYPRELYYGLHSTERGLQEKQLEELGASRNSPHSAMHVYPRQGRSNLFPSMGRDHVSTTSQTKQKLQNSWYYGFADASIEGLNAQTVKLAVKPLLAVRPELNEFL